MGNEKTTTKQETQQQTTYTASPEEREQLSRQNQILSAGQQDQINLNKNASNIVNSLLLGQSLPGYLNALPGGISEDIVNSMTRQSLNDIMPQFQASGILDSGTAAQIASRTSADIRNQAGQFNIQNLMQLLNVGVGGQAQVQQPLLTTSGQYGQSLSGLRSINQTGSSTNTTLGMNPFLKSFQQSLGQSLGNVRGRIPFGGGSTFGGG